MIELQQEAEHEKKNCSACTGPLESACENCENGREAWSEPKGRNRTYYRVPDWLSEKYFLLFSPSELRIFLYLNKKANRDPKHLNFGRCWASFSEITQATRLKERTIRNAVKKLQKLKLVKRDMRRVTDPATGKFKTINEWTVTWFKQERKMKKKFATDKKAKKGKAKKKHIAKEKNKKKSIRKEKEEEAVRPVQEEREQVTTQQPPDEWYSMEPDEYSRHVMDKYLSDQIDGDTLSREMNRVHNELLRRGEIKERSPEESFEIMRKAAARYSRWLAEKGYDQR
jgi:hypothetical protein